MKLVMTRDKDNRYEFTYTKKVIILNNILHLMRHVQCTKLSGVDELSWIDRLYILCNVRMDEEW